MQLVVGDAAGNVSEAITTSVSALPGEVFAGGPYLVIGDDDLRLTAIMAFELPGGTEFSWDLDGDGDFDDAVGRAPTLDAAALDDLRSRTGEEIISIAVQATVLMSTSFVGRGTITFISGVDSGDEWHNSLNALDVDRDTVITPVDALLVINELNTRQFGDANGVLAPAPDLAPSYVDVDDDGFVSPVDALQIINGLPSEQPILSPGAILAPTSSRAEVSLLQFDEYWLETNEEDKRLRADAVDLFHALL